jgi:hypothetical protein
LAVGRSAAVNTDFLRFEKSIDCLKYTYDWGRTLIGTSP